MIFRQLFEKESSTYTYILADDSSREAVIIDPVVEMHRRDRAVIREMGLKPILSLDTHCHADHITGSWLLKQAFACDIAIGAKSGVKNADRMLEDQQRLSFGGHHLKVLATPGHTSGCSSYVLGEGERVFTGDSLLIRGCGRTDFQAGCAKTLFRSIKDKLFGLPDTCEVYPGHDYQGRTMSSIGEEKQFNPRIGGKANEGDFVGFMDNMRLPHPHKIAMALPANLKSGKIDPTREATESWAPLEQSYGGVQQLETTWVAEHLQDLVVIDVREPDEFEGELGHIPGAKLIPLSLLEGVLPDMDKTAATIMVCRSGRRSALATQMLQEAGFGRVANLKDGMLGWSEQGLPLA